MPTLFLRLVSRNSFQLFDAQRRSPRVELLVRARQYRVVGERQLKLFATMRSGPPDGRIDIEVDGLAARPESSRKKARIPRRKRLANCKMRFRHVSLPETEGREGTEPRSLSTVHVVETAPRKDKDPIQWFLLTTCKVGTAKEAAEIVGFYLQCCRIEAVFRASNGELGLRPIWHQGDNQIRAHLFIAVLAYHAVHLIRTRFKMGGNDLC